MFDLKMMMKKKKKTLTATKDVEGRCVGAHLLCGALSRQG